MSEEKNRVHVLPLLVGLTIGLSILVLSLIIGGSSCDLPHYESTNADFAYEWFIETNNITYDYPSCSLEARMWIDEYRNHNNLTHTQFRCVIWLNDMNDWFYY